jgi:hypothetical protein
VGNAICSCVVVFFDLSARKVWKSFQRCVQEYLARCRPFEAFRHRLNLLAMVEECYGTTEMEENAMKILTSMDVLLIGGGSPRDGFQGPPLRVDSVDWGAIDGWGELIPLPPLRSVEMVAV